MMEQLSPFFLPRFTANLLCQIADLQDAYHKPAAVFNFNVAI